ncbi:amidohydrolase [Phanerochaete sordida]|uniref:Amidohydrolase n=1 Tax=Phanerochaete sordida TaxID=48140 RepID=A0A9P3GIK9_9APHY|nr:amidohydrolase [Phanerochaete sordida]
MNVKQPGPEKGPEHPTSSSAGKVTASSGVRNYLPWVLVAVALAGASYFLARRPAAKEDAGITRLPESYGLCGEPGKIYTVDDDHPKVDCILVRKDEILATGTRDDIARAWDAYQVELVNKFYGGEPKAKKPLTVRATPPGSIVVPGLADAHAHLVQYGFKAGLPLDTAESLDAVLDILEGYVRAHPENLPEEWIGGFGWDQTRWKDWSGEFPTAAHLSSRELLAGRPIYLSRVDGHAMWVSPRALELTRKQLPGQRWPPDSDIEGGEILRDIDGNPTGVFVDNAMTLVAWPPWTPTQIESYLETAVKDVLRVGLTSVHDAAALPEYIDAFAKFADDDRLPIRVYAMGNSENMSYWGESIPRFEDYGARERLNVRSIKLFTDGALGSWGAALLEPYTDKPDARGIMRVSEDNLEAFVKRFWEDGWGVNIHCIGDRANKVVLDIFERVLKVEASQTGESLRDVAARRRPRIEHAQIMRAEDLGRAGALGIITSVQPTHATSDMWYAETRLGPERIKGAYAYQTLLQASPNGVLPLGSDFPVEGINPLLGFYAAVTRLDVHGRSPHGAGGWFPRERLSRAQALKGMTRDAAYASFVEDRLGSLAPGKKADYVVFDRDFVDEAIPAEEILLAQVRATVVDGRVEYGMLSADSD